MHRKRILAGVLLVVGVAAALVAYAGRDGNSSDAASSPTTIPQPTQAQLEASGLAALPLAPESERVDIAAPTFSTPTSFTNPLFPISELHSAILNGTVEGKPFHTETTLLPQTRIIEWAEGQQVETLVSQYVAYLDGRIEEVALDYYAQADDGSVWYFGEDVFNYSEDGTIADTEGTWLAGKEGPPAMIMPARPQIGDAHRPENVPGLVFEEVAVKSVDETVDGPTGPVDGAIVGQELHQDGSFSDKTFAPGYGEFYSAHEGDVEAIALAVPTDALDGPPPTELEALSAGADDTFTAVRARDWKATAAGVAALTDAWEAHRAGGVPPRLATEMARALETLARAVETRDWPEPARRRSTLPDRRSISSFATALPPISTAPASSSGRGRSSSTRRLATRQGSEATSRPSSGSAIDSRTRSTGSTSLASTPIWASFERVSATRISAERRQRLSASGRRWQASSRRAETPGAALMRFSSCVRQ